MHINKTAIPEILMIEPDVFADDRGFFLETYHATKFAEAGIPDTFVQDNHSGSRKGVLRGLHYQIRQAQGKLVRVLVGDIFDVTVDLRRKSTTFGKWVGMRLSADKKTQLWIPPGFAHGFYVLTDWAEVLYKTTNTYAPQWERILSWNDPDLAIEWPIPLGQDPVLSPKDALGKRLGEAEIFD
jgi:dTDP-4-dehydrorhamnose 3,5-epimerase